MAVGWPHRLNRQPDWVLPPAGAAIAVFERAGERGRIVSSSEQGSSRSRQQARVPGSTGFGVHVTDVAGFGFVVCVVGQVDIATAGMVDQGLWLASTRSGDPVVLDLARVTFMDAAGLRVVVGAHQRRVAAGGGGVSVRGARGIVHRVFELTGFSMLLDDVSQPCSSGNVVADHWRGKLEAGRREAGLSVVGLHVAYLALGGTAQCAELGSYLQGAGAGVMDRHQRDIAVHAVNERLIEVGRADSLLSYAAA
jgi:anti-sigma B factor antagonist